jgi:uncharacterized membrane-anchored protein
MTRRVLFLIGLLLELVAVFGLFLPYVWLASSGTLISLRTVPVDPRSIFRGDYVTLSYEAGADIQLPAAMEGVNPPTYVVLERRGDVFERVRVSEGKPPLQAGQACLRGYPSWNGITFPDIAQFFVEEETGRQFEDATRAHRLIVDVLVNDSCAAVIRGVRLGAEVPQAEWNERQGLDPFGLPLEKPIPPTETGATAPVR